jgi:aspartate/methionine/tyrosine aminotransferase
MAKISDPNAINLAVSEPRFLQEELLKSSILSSCTAPLTDLEYPPFGGVPGLIEAVRQIDLVKSYKHIVITNGAKQAILAALYVAGEVRRAKRLVHRAPYWPSYPTLAYQIGLQFSSEGEGESTVVAITSPNNPDGTQFADTKCYLWDAAYASPLYGFNGATPDCDVVVLSFAKLFGISGLRVGLAASNDGNLAESMAYYVEISTSGVSITSQNQCTKLINYIHTPQGNMEFNAILNSAADTLSQNRLTFENLIAPQCESWVAKSGMFAWFKPLRAAAFERSLMESKVRLVDGEACGMPGWFRMSLGVDTETFGAASRAIAGLSDV